MKRIVSQTDRPTRRGFLTPLIVFAILIVMGTVALVLDHLWLEAASQELQTCAEAAALAAGRELASDDWLCCDHPAIQPIAAGRLAAAAIAAQNRVAGTPVHLDSSDSGDVRFGRLVRNPESGRVMFVETDQRPTTVVVTARRTRSRNNPVALLLQNSRNRGGADVVARAEASLDHRVIGIRPLDGAPVPALPLAILKSDPTGQIAQTWNSQIERRLGQDRFSFHSDSNRVVSKPDGVPEIVLQYRRPYDRSNGFNTQLIDLGNGLRQNAIIRQIQYGLAKEDLADFGGALNLYSQKIVLPSSPDVTAGVLAALRQVVGEVRICFLYDRYETNGEAGSGQIHCAGLVAGRVMDVDTRNNGVCRIVYQPAVVITRTALLAESGDEEPPIANAYICKLHLTQ